ncbi:MAG: hypothetical protein FWC71_06170 [Defluviitaleaceae bacterium]|nr:hypothetical protein [Defluviitaleaceae bacterium]
MKQFFANDKMGILWIVLTVVAAVGFYFAVMQFDQINRYYEHPYIIGLMLTLLFLSAGLIIAFMLPSPGEIPERAGECFVTLALFLLMTAGLISLRGAFFYFESNDYLYYLRHWIASLRNMTVPEALSYNVSDHNMPYVYILLGISRLDYTPLYFIKFISGAFDIVLAFFVMKLVAFSTGNVKIHLAVFLGTLAIPTVVLNGAMWGQNDSVYAAFALGSLYFAMAGKSKWAFAFFGLAISFKLQAVFILPMFIVFCMAGRIKARDFWLVPAVFVALLAPAVISGMPPLDALTIYFDRFNNYGGLNSNAMGLWRLVGWGIEEAQFITAGLFIGGIGVCAALYFAFTNRDKLTQPADFIYLAYIFAAGMPFVLPKMHDRYLFLADVLSIVLVAFNKKLWFVPIVTILASYTSYVWTLMGHTTLINYVYLSVALGVVIIYVIKDLAERLAARKSRDEIDELEWV